jgi:hypothetical protein
VLRLAQATKADVHGDSALTAGNGRTIINVCQCLRGERSKTNQVSIAFT